MALEKTTTHWRSKHLRTGVDVARWGSGGRPLLLFPTAGGDFEECERFHMLDVLEPLVSSGRTRVYSCDSVAGRVWIDGESGGARRAEVQGAFDRFVADELVPAIRADGGGGDPLVAGASIGAYEALAAICRHPETFAAAICMSGTYDLTRWMEGEHTLDFHFASPLHFLPTLGPSRQLDDLRRRFVLLATGSGDYEAPWESWRVANVLGAKGIPNRVDDWGPRWRHDWVTWRAMLPKYLDELLAKA
jgi:esterase/lipase superfamily enzyme